LASCGLAVDGSRFEACLHFLTPLLHHPVAPSPLQCALSCALYAVAGNDWQRGGQRLPEGAYEATWTWSRLCCCWKRVNISGRADLLAAAAVNLGQLYISVSGRSEFYR